MMKKIAITSGDPDGIGLEVTAKALEKIGPQKNIQFYLFRSGGGSPALLRRISRRFRRKEFPTWPLAMDYKTKDHKVLIDIASSLPPARWVETAAHACRLGHLDALVTAPLSKQTIIKSGLKDLGHTDILKRVCGNATANMGFVGKYFSVVLATGHVPLKDVSSALTAQSLFEACRQAHQLRGLLDKKKQRLPIALLGLNPHAGDQGLIGSEELTLFKDVLLRLEKEKIPCLGPLVPDAAFLPENWKKYSVFVACYHDQGLVPFKAIHGHDSGVHLTLGLPLKRTSVDHGTAKDIFGKNKAKPGSMIDALEFAIEWAKKES